jgi:mono/diheme cytochrome c family protein
VSGRHAARAALLGVFAAALSAAAAQEGDASKGLGLAQDLCASCHAIGRDDASRHPRAPTFVAIAATPGMTALALGVALRTSHREMPNIVLDDEQRVLRS